MRREGIGRLTHHCHSTRVCRALCVGPLGICGLSGACDPSFRSSWAGARFRNGKWASFGPVLHGRSHFVSVLYALHQGHHATRIQRQDGCTSSFLSRSVRVKWATLSSLLSMQKDLRRLPIQRSSYCQTCSDGTFFARQLVKCSRLEDQKRAAVPRYWNQELAITCLEV